MSICMPSTAPARCSSSPRSCAFSADPYTYTTRPSLVMPRPDRQT